VFGNDGQLLDTLGQKLYHSVVMKKNLVLVLILILVLVLFSAERTQAESSSPEALTAASGLSTVGELINFGVLGEGAAGVISDTDYISGAGLAAMIFTPLLPQAGAPIPTVLTLEGDVICCPSPFNPDSEIANIAYRLTQDAEVKIYIFDILGQRIKTIATSSTYRGADGYSRASWNGQTGFGNVVSNGVYLVQIVSEGKIIGRTKVIAVR
jgi:hypothetical protein